MDKPITAAGKELYSRFENSIARGTMDKKIPFCLWLAHRPCCTEEYLSLGDIPEKVLTVQMLEYLTTVRGRGNDTDFNYSDAFQDDTLTYNKYIKPLHDEFDAFIETNCLYGEVTAKILNRTLRKLF